MIRAVSVCTSLLASAMLLSACGNKGELFLPEDSQVSRELDELGNPQLPVPDGESEESTSGSKSKRKPQGS